MDWNTPGAEMLGKANAVLTALESAGELTVGEIAEAVGLPTSSTYRLLKTLTSLGLVDAGSQPGLFRLGVYFMFIGGMMEQRLDLRNTSREVFQQLSAQTDWTYTLYVPRGSRAVCVERLDSPSVQSNVVRLGDSLPMYTGAGPRAILAFLPHEQQHAVLEEIYGLEPGKSDTAPQPAVGTRPQRAALEEDLGTDHRRGHVISDEELARGIAAVGVPIYNHRGMVQGAVSVSYLRHIVLAPDSDVVDTARRAAASISRSLGCPVQE